MRDDSPARIEILTAYYKHPLEITSESIATAVLLYPVLGASPEAAFAITTASGVLGLFYHWNVATRRGWATSCSGRRATASTTSTASTPTTTPSCRSVDILFGTFRNPRRFVGQCGLGGDREQQFAARLLGHDVTRPKP